MIKILKTISLGAFLMLGVANVPHILAGDMVPLKSTAVAQYETRQFLANPATSPLGTPFLLITASGGGIASHMGKYSIDILQLISLQFINGQFVLVADGTFTATAANGDQLFGTFRNLVKVVDLATLTGEDTFVGFSNFTGGTGRFIGATGEETTVGEIAWSPDGLHQVSWEHEGLISSVGSSKKK